MIQLGDYFGCFLFLEGAFQSLVRDDFSPVAEVLVPLSSWVMTDNRAAFLAASRLVWIRISFIKAGCFHAFSEVTLNAWSEVL